MEIRCTLTRDLSKEICKIADDLDTDIPTIVEGLIVEGLEHRRRKAAIAEQVDKTVAAEEERKQQARMITYTRPDKNWFARIFGG